MTHIEAMKQAIEALMPYRSTITREYTKVDAAIDALRQAIAEAEKQEPVAWISIDSIGERYLCFDKPLDNDPVQPLYTTPPQRIEQEPEQEPVAWLDPWTRNNVTTDYDAYGNNGIPLYAAPPQRTEPISLQCAHCQVTIETLNDKVMHLLAQRTWVGLTDEEMHECAGEYPWTPTGLKHARTIEAKLKQKNGFTEEKNT